MSFGAYAYGTLPVGTGAVADAIVVLNSGGGGHSYFYDEVYNKPVAIKIADIVSKASTSQRQDTDVKLNLGIIVKFSTHENSGESNIVADSFDYEIEDFMMMLIT